MLLQSLYHLYERLTLEPEYAVAANGFSLQKIAFSVTVSDDGEARIEDLREREGKKLLAVQTIVPGQAKPSGSGLNPCFLWDNTGYLLGYKPDDPKPERTAEAFAAFRERHLALEDEIADEGFSAVCRFLEKWDPAEAATVPLLAELSTGFGVFRLQGDLAFVHDRPDVRSWWLKQQSEPEEAGSALVAQGECLVTGRQGRIATLHKPAIKGVGGAQSSGALLVSFNCDAFTSYGKQQSVNAPVSEEAVFRYCTALNAILSGPRSDRHRLSLGDSTLVFWTAKRTVTEGFLAFLLAGNPPDAQAQDPATLQTVRSLLEALRQGSGSLATLGDAPETPFFLLGLAPNAARLSVRFWHESTLGDFFDRLKAHYDALRIVRQWDETSKRPDHEFPPLWLLLRQTGRESKDIPPLLGGALMRAVLTGQPYPDALATAVINRIRADREINHPRAAILKAWLTRLPNHPHSIPMSLDLEKTDPAYRLGRLFAVLEKTQEDALGEVGASIRDRFYSSASATPGVVFPRLLRTYQHHLSKLPHGQKVGRERLVQEIMGALNDFPGFLPLEDQALFAIGYYHQRKDLFTKREPSATAAQPAEPASIA